MGACLLAAGATHAQCRIGSGPDFGDGIPYCSDPPPEDYVVPSGPAWEARWGAIAIDPKLPRAAPGAPAPEPAEVPIVIRLERAKLGALKLGVKNLTTGADVKLVGGVGKINLHPLSGSVSLTRANVEGEKTFEVSLGATSVDIAAVRLPLDSGITSIEPSGLTPVGIAHPVVVGFGAPVRDRAAAVRKRNLPPVGGEERTRLVEQAQTDFQDFAIIGDATGTLEDGILTLTVDLRPPG